MLYYKNGVYCFRSHLNITQLRRQFFFVKIQLNKEIFARSGKELYRYTLKEFDAYDEEVEF